MLILPQPLALRNAHLCQIESVADLTPLKAQLTQLEGRVAADAAAAMSLRRQTDATLAAYKALVDVASATAVALDARLIELEAAAKTTSTTATHP